MTPAADGVFLYPAAVQTHSVQCVIAALDPVQPIAVDLCLCAVFGADPRQLRTVIRPKLINGILLSTSVTDKIQPAVIEQQNIGRSGRSVDQRLLLCAVCAHFADRGESG